MNNKNKVLIVSLTAVLSVGIAAAVLTSNNALPIHAEEVTHTITLSSTQNTLREESEDFESGSTTVYTDQLHNPRTFNYGYVCYGNGGFYTRRDFTSGNPGFISNAGDSPIGSIKSITVRGASNAYTIYYGWETDEDGNPIYDAKKTFTCNTTGKVVSFTDYPSYFQFRNSDNDGSYIIYEITISFSSNCVLHDKPVTA